MLGLGVSRLHGSWWGFSAGVGAEGLPWAEGPGPLSLPKAEPRGDSRGWLFNVTLSFSTSPLSFKLGVLCTSSAFMNELKIYPQIMVSQWQAHSHGLSLHSRRPPQLSSSQTCVGERLGPNSGEAAPPALVPSLAFQRVATWGHQRPGLVLPA